MTPRRDDFSARKDEILRITIDQYIANVSPVSSARIVDQCTYDVSSATVRNILAELEEQGFLTHPHTSAGRIPTDRGYRYYVDHFLNEIYILEEEKARIKADYQRETLEVEHLLMKTSKVLSETTHYASIVSLDGHEDKLFCGGTSFILGYPDYHDVAKDILKIQKILAALEEKERLLGVINRNLAKKVDILIGNEINCSEIDSCSLVVSQYKSSRGPSGRIAVLGPTRMNYQKVVSTLEYFSDLMEELL